MSANIYGPWMDGWMDQDIEINIEYIEHFQHFHLQFGIFTIM